MAKFTVQRITPPDGMKFIHLDSHPGNQAGVRVRDLFKAHKTKRAEDLDFTVPMHDIGAFGDTRDWDGSTPLAELPQIWRPIRTAGRFALIVMSGSGSSLLAELSMAGELLCLDTIVRVYPHPLHLPLDVRLEHDGVYFGLSAENSKSGSDIEITAAPSRDPDGRLYDPVISATAVIGAKEKEKIYAAIDKEMIAWGEALSAQHGTNRGADAGWPSELCRHVLPDQARSTALAEIIRAAGILAYQQFDIPGTENLVISLQAPERPSSLAGSEDRPWSVFVNIKNAYTSDEMRYWIEDILRASLSQRWPEGWYEVIGPTVYSRLGVQSQGSRTMAKLRGPFSNHEKIEALDLLGEFL